MDAWKAPLLIEPLARLYGELVEECSRRRCNQGKPEAWRAGGQDARYMG